MAKSKEVSTPQVEVVSRGGGLTKEQLKAYFSRKYAEQDQRSDVVKELYDREDLSLVTETHAQMVLPKVGMAVYLEALNPKRTKPLIQVWLEAYNKEMISFKRQGRLELLGALQALSMSEGEGESSTRV